MIKNWHRAMSMTMVALCSMHLGCSSDGSDGDAAEQASAHNGVIAAADFTELADQVASELDIPDGYDLNLDLIEVSSMTSTDMESMLRFRSVCLWAHYALVSDEWSDASSSIAVLSDDSSVRDSGVGSFLADVEASVEGGDVASIEQFIAANCAGMGLPATP